MLALGDPVVTQLGVGGMFALMILERVFAYVGKKRNGNGNGRMTTTHLIRDMHDILSKEDTDNVKLVYHRRTLERAIDDLTAVVRDMQTEQAETRRVLKALAQQLAAGKP